MERFSFDSRRVLPALLVLCSLAAAGTTELPIKMGDTEMEIGDRLRIRSKVMGEIPSNRHRKSPRRKCGCWTPRWADRLSRPACWMWRETR